MITIDHAAQIITADLKPLGLGTDFSMQDVAARIARYPAGTSESYYHALAQTIYREIMLSQALAAVRLEQQIDEGGWKDFFARAGTALAALHSSCSSSTSGKPTGGRSIFTSGAKFSGRESAPKRGTPSAWERW